jgi:hypothetical protein
MRWRQTPHEWDRKWNKNVAPSRSAADFWVELAFGVFFALALFKLSSVADSEGARLLARLVQNAILLFMLWWVTSVEKAPPTVKELNAFYEERSNGINPIGAIELADENGGELSVLDHQTGEMSEVQDDKLAQ